MDKLKLAHEYALEMAKQGIPLKSCKELGWKYADAMQAEADKRNKAEAAKKRKEIREMLNAPNTFVEREGQHFDDVADIQKPYASSEAFCEVDWRQAPENAVAFLKLSDWDIPAWIDEHGIQIEDAPSFGFTGSHVVERPHGF